MLQVKNLTITHRKDLTVLVKDLHFTLDAGDRAAIIGEEGNGKSTVLRLLADPALVEDYVDWTGEVVAGGLRRGYLSQELTPAQLALPVWQFCSQDEAFAAADPGALAGAAAAVGLSADCLWEDRPLGTLSGGERVKLRLALLKLAQPDILLLDEPSNDLDLATLAWLEKFILSADVPVLYISHDETLLSKTANVIIHLERLRRRTLPRCTVQKTDYQSYVQARAAGFARQEQLARKQQAEYDAKMEKYRQIRDKVEHQQATVSRQAPGVGRLLKKKMHAVLSTGRRFEREKEDMTPLPEWEEAILTAFDPTLSTLPAGKSVLRYEAPQLVAGDRVLASGLRLWVTGPEKIGIVGANGVGKSTLLKALCDQLLPRADLRCAYMPQDYGDLLDGGQTPVQLLAPDGSHQAVTRARTLLGSMKYTALEMDHPAARLSGGQQAKLLFLAMVLRGSNVLLLDEPTRNFSPLSAPVIRGVLAEFPGAILSVSHDRLYLREVCTRVLTLTPDGLQETRLD